MQRPSNTLQAPLSAQLASVVRELGNRLVGILHGCLARRIAYQEQVAWPTAKTVA